MEGIIIGLTTSIMIIFITFLWQKALAVDSVLGNVEDKIEEMVQTINDSNDIIVERIEKLELEANLVEPDYEDKLLTVPMPVQQVLPQIQQYQKGW